MEELKTVQCSEEGRELYKILQSPHIQVDYIQSFSLPVCIPVCLALYLSSCLCAAGPPVIP